MTLNFIGLHHYFDTVVATGVGIIVGVAVGYAIARSNK